MLRPCCVCPALPTLLAVVCGTVLCADRSAEAQDFRVVTHVSQRPDAKSRWQPVGQSVTLFHAGKVYDYMEQLGEVVVFEPTESKFLILSFKGNNQATTLEFAELQQFLKVARTQMGERIDQLAGKAAQTETRRQALQFQLNPAFEETYDPSTKTLTLISPLLRYEVETEKTNRPLVVQEYLQYADWAARINYVLHSRALYPEVRLAVNRSLAARGVIPTQVRLMLDGENPVLLKAEHKFDWSLSAIDKSTIRQCEKARTADSTRWVDFRDYQRDLVAENARR